MAAAKPKIVFWKPGGVVRGSQVYLDANFLVGLAWAEHIWQNSASALLASLSERKTKLLLSSLALNEAIYQLMRLEEKDRARQAESDEEEDWEEEGDREEIKPVRLGWAERLDETLLSLPDLAFFEPPDVDFHRQVIRAVRDLNLDPTDAFHYSAARRVGCPLVSNDVGFQKIPDQNLVVVTFF